MSRPLVVHDARFLEHRPSRPHPETPERLGALDAVLEPRAAHVERLAPRAATDEEILAIHDRAYLELLRAQQGRSDWLDPDTYLSPRSVEVARLAAGSTIELALRIARGAAREGFSLVRPPGHHAEGDRAMGFCLLNHVALAARALQREGLERVAILDWDVHHGNGTQHLFERERDVLYLSLHQFPFYPGTGSLAECGEGAGEGSTLNLPMPQGCTDAEYCRVFEAVVVPALREFAPAMILVSAGFDAHARDPLGGMQLSTQGYRRMLRALRELAADICGGRLLLALEGGYDLDALADCVGSALDELGQSAGSSRSALELAPQSTRLADSLISLFRERHAHYWSALG